jgi:hypothetical protein
MHGVGIYASIAGIYSLMIGSRDIFSDANRLGIYALIGVGDIQGGAAKNIFCTNQYKT